MVCIKPCFLCTDFETGIPNFAPSPIELPSPKFEKIFIGMHKRNRDSTVEDTKRRRIDNREAMSPLALPEQVCRLSSPIGPLSGSSGGSNVSAALFAILAEEKIRVNALEDSLIKALTETTPPVQIVLAADKTAEEAYHAASSLRTSPSATITSILAGKNSTNR